MPKLSDTALVILSNAAKRDARLVLPLPKSVKGGIKGATPILKTLIKQKLIAELNAVGKMPVWREDKDNRITLIVTDAGLKAIGIESNEVAQPPKAAKAKTERAAASPKPTASAGKSKLDLLKEMLQRKEGMTVVEQIVGQGLILMFNKEKPQVIAADAQTQATMGFAPSSTTGNGQSRVSPQDAKHYAITEGGGCSSVDGEGNVAVGWHAAPTLVDADKQEEDQEELPTSVLRPGDMISIDLDSNCPSVVGVGDTSVNMSYSYTTRYPAFIEASPTFVLVGLKQ